MGFFAKALPSSTSLKIT